MPTGDASDDAVWPRHAGNGYVIYDGTYRQWRYSAKERPPGAYGRCYDCGRPYGSFPDMTVPDAVWESINPSAFEGGGILCPGCIGDRLAALGVGQDVGAVFHLGGTRWASIRGPIRQVTAAATTATRSARFIVQALREAPWTAFDPPALVALAKDLARQGEERESWIVEAQVLGASREAIELHERLVQELARTGPFEDWSAQRAGWRALRRRLALGRPGSPACGVDLDNWFDLLWCEAVAFEAHELARRMKDSTTVEMIARSYEVRSVYEAWRENAVELWRQADPDKT